MRPWVSTGSKKTYVTCWTMISRISSLFLTKCPSFVKHLYADQHLLPLVAVSEAAPDSQLCEQDTLLAELGGICTIMLAPPAQVLVREGHPGEALFMVLSGDVRVTARGKRLATLGAGSYFGEIALLKSVNTTASVAAVEGCLLLVLHRPQFEQLLHKVPVLRTALEAYVGDATASSGLVGLLTRVCVGRYVTARTGNRIASLNVSLFAGISEVALIRLSEVAQFKR